MVRGMCFMDVTSAKNLPEHPLPFSALATSLVISQWENLACISIEITSVSSFRRHHSHHHVKQRDGMRGYLSPRPCLKRGDVKMK